ncbi:hypothetical protein KCQ63_29825, partial [Klebsiella pneumoniae]|nr:hypothetical protein [Klebsiella pneumoniae]
MFKIKQIYLFVNLVYLISISTLSAEGIENPNPEKPVEPIPYVSPMKEKGLDPEFNRHMFVEPSLSKHSATATQFWLN